MVHEELGNVTIMRTRKCIILGTISWKELFAHQRPHCESVISLLKGRRLSLHTSKPCPLGKQCPVREHHSSSRVCKAAFVLPSYTLWHSIKLLFDNAQIVKNKRSVPVFRHLSPIHSHDRRRFTNKPFTDLPLERCDGTRGRRATCKENK